MEIRNLISFKKIAELRSFSKAAVELGYSQSTVTMQIKQLESELQVNLFDRIGKTIRLTNEGNDFLCYASEIISIAENARQVMSKDTVPKGELIIGLMESVCTAYLPQILNEFHTAYPGVNTIIKIGTYQELSNMLNTNSIDILWVFDTPIETKEWSRVFTYESDISVICSPQNELASRTKVNLSDIILEPFILTEQNCSYRTIFENTIFSLGLKPNVFLEIGNTEIIKKFVASNLGISVLPMFTVIDELKSNRLSQINLSEFSLTMQGQLFVHKNKWLTPGLNSFIDVVKKII
ncbi:MAG TPA: LysR family transcriptional regulator [Mobilitalea sp.]|nr:LysR family transcriptional regulator [Mobilitalea sp.]